MTERGEGFVGEDIVRLFFRQRISNLVDVLEHLLKHVKAVLSSSADVETRSSELLEANRIILVRHKRQETTSSACVCEALTKFDPLF